jgi:GNAT superfamily N-acetyltransferase
VPADASGKQIEVRAFAASDAAFLARIAARIRPAATTSPRDPASMDRFFAQLASGRLLTEPGAEAFVATIDDERVGLISVHPDVDYFTGHARAYVDVLVVAPEAEGLGVGRGLMNHAEGWARQHGCREVVLDVFANNVGAIAFYERCGYRPDHIRMAKSLV